MRWTGLNTNFDEHKGNGKPMGKPLPITSKDPNPDKLIEKRKRHVRINFDINMRYIYTSKSTSRTSAIYNMRERKDGKEELYKGEKREENKNTKKFSYNFDIGTCNLVCTTTSSECPLVSSSHAISCLILAAVSAASSSSISSRGPLPNMVHDLLGVYDSGRGMM